MPIVRRRQQATANLIQRRFLDAAALVGERAIVLRTFHPFTDPDATRCNYCWNAVYQQSEEPSDCYFCYGTTYNPTFREITIIRGIFQTGEDKTVSDKTGEYIPNSITAQVEAYPSLHKGDIICRVDHWETYTKPGTIGGRFRVATTKVNDLRVGTYQPKHESRIGQNLTITEIPKKHIIYEFPLTGKEIALPKWPQP